MPVILLGDINEWFVRGRALQALVTRFRRAPAPRTFPTVYPVFSLDRIWIHPGEWLVDVVVHAAHVRGMRRITTRSSRGCGCRVTRKGSPCCARPMRGERFRQRRARHANRQTRRNG